MLRKVKSGIFLPLFLFIVTAAFAQSRSFSGQIWDGETPLPGVNITVKGVKGITVTDINGRFTINNVPVGHQTLMLTYVGYQTLIQEVEDSLGLVDLGVIRMYSNDHKNTLSNVVVSSSTRRATEARALNMQKGSNRIVNIIAADGIGKLPDRNAGEAVQRVAGVVLERDQGEGRFISVRGLPAEWSSATINGDRLPTAEEQTVSRSTAFDFFPSELIQFVEVSKALTPDLEGDAMGGSVNFVTRTSVEKKTFDISAAAGYNQKSGKPVFSGSLLIGGRNKNNRFGYFLQGTIWNRNWATDNFEPRFSGDFKRITRMELRDYVGVRRTLGFNGAADYRLAKNSKLYVRGMYGSLNDNETHYKLRLRYENQRAEAQSISNILRTGLYGLDLGGEFGLGHSSFLDFKVSHYSNDFKYGDIPNKEIPSYLIVQYDQRNIGYTNLIEGKYVSYKIDGGDIDPQSPATHLPDQNSVNNTALYNFSSVQMQRNHIKETDHVVGQLNFKKDIKSGFKFKAGVKFRDKERNQRADLPTWRWRTGTTEQPPAYATVATAEKPGINGYVREFGNQFAGIFPAFISKDGISDFFNANRNNLVLDSAGSTLLENGGATASNFDVYEKHSSGYLMGTWSLSSMVTLIGGLRAENTDLKVNGWLYEPVEGQPGYRGKLTPQTQKNNYTVWLPMLHLKYSPRNNMNLRLAATKTFSRPDFGSLVAGGNYDLQDNRLDYGNPGLKPIKSYNLDVMGEYYFGNVGAITAGAFYKRIVDPIFKDSKIYDEYEGYQNVRVTQDLNGQQAHVAGFEIGVSRKFDFLPGFLSGFGLNTNYTFVRSEMRIPGRDGATRIPGQANDIFNAALFYEKGGFQLRLALNFKGQNIIGHGETDDTDEYFGKSTSMDANISYRLGRSISFFAEANNLLNSRFEFYIGDPGRPSQVEYYGVRGQAGIKASIF